MNRVDTFDPDAVTRDLARPPALVLTLPVADEMPVEWRRGVELLNAMAVPRGATPERWAQIVQDATRFAWWGHEKAIAAGWSIGSIFGFDPDEPDGLISLVLAIRGGRVTGIDHQRARIEQPGQVRFHRREMLDAAPPLWMFRGSR